MRRFVSIGVAGEGEYGIVLKCKRKATNEMVAIKQFKEDDRVDDEAARVIKREVDILKILRHEHIIRMHEVFRENGTLHIVFDYIDKCLIDIIEMHPHGVGAERAQALIRQLTLALAHCHGKQVIHRDVKPDNLLVNSADGSLRLCDFGSACNTSSKQVLTDYVATRWYRAPELLVRFNNYGPGVDIWGLGCVMAEIIVGWPLFAGESDLDQLFIINNGLGPLTPEQNKRCFDLTGFIKFPDIGSDRPTLKKRLGHLLTDQQLQFLSGLLVVDPSARLTANSALSTLWLTTFTVSSRISGPNLHNLQPMQKAVGSQEETVVGTVAATNASEQATSEDTELASRPALRGCVSGQQCNAFAPKDSCDISIMEEISHESGTDECVDSSPGSMPAQTSEQELTAPDVAETHVGSSTSAVAIGGAISDAGMPVLGMQESIAPLNTASSFSLQTSNLDNMSRKQPDLGTSITLSIGEVLESKPHDQCEDSIIEELILEDTVQTNCNDNSKSGAIAHAPLRSASSEMASVTPRRFVGIKASSRPVSNSSGRNFVNNAVSNLAAPPSLVGPSSLRTLEPSSSHSEKPAQVSDSSARSFSVDAAIKRPMPPRLGSPDPLQQSELSSQQSAHIRPESHNSSRGKSYIRPASNSSVRSSSLFRIE